MDLAPQLIDVRVPRNAVGAVLVLHGGAGRQHNMQVSPTQLSVLRMVPIARGLARAGRGRLAVFRLLNSVRGWDTKHTPVDDATWALEEMERRLGRRLPTCLVGHSLGGRAALLSANRPGVVSAVALAPWVYPHDAVHAPGRRLLIVHGSEDRVASPANAAMLAARVERSNDIGFVLLCGGRHAMLRKHRRFFALTRDFVSATLLERPARGPVAKVLAGERWQEV